MIVYNPSIDFQCVRVSNVLREGGFVFVALTILKLSCRWITGSSKALIGIVIPLLALYLFYLIGALPCNLLYHLFTKERRKTDKRKTGVQEPLFPVSESQEQGEELESSLSAKLVRLELLEHSGAERLARLSLRPTKRLTIHPCFYTIVHF